MRHARGRAALDRAGADLGHADMGEHGAEGVDFLFIDVAMGLDCHVAARQAGAPGRDDGVDAAVLAPIAQPLCDLGALVAHDGTGGQNMPGPFDPGNQRIARAVIVCLPRIANGQHGDAHGDEFAGLINVAHGSGPFQYREARSQRREYRSRDIAQPARKARRSGHAPPEAPREHTDGTVDDQTANAHDRAQH